MLVLKPENVSVRMGESAQFYCQAKGDPPPAVVWSREQGALPNGRYFIMARHKIYSLDEMYMHLKYSNIFLAFQLLNVFPLGQHM